MHDPLPTVESKGLTDVQLAELDAVVTETPADRLIEETDDWIVKQADDEEGPWVFRARPRLVERLAEAAEPDLDRIAEEWAASEEMEVEDEDDRRALRELISGVADLAREARATGRDLYLWVSL